MVRYEALNACLARSAALPLRAAQDALTGQDASCEPLIFLEDPLFSVALEVASESLVDQIVGPAVERRPDARRSKRVRDKVIRYRSRAGSRATPFGLFSAVGMCRIDDVPVGPIEVMAGLACLVRPDVAIGLNETRTRKTMVRTNDLIRTEGERWVLDSEDATRTGPRVRVGRTGPAQLCLERAVGGTTKDELLAELAAAYPGTEPERLATLLNTLEQTGLLLPAPRPRLHGVAIDEDHSYVILGGDPPDLPRCLKPLRRTELDAQSRKEIRQLSTQLRSGVESHQGPTVQVDTAMRVTGALSKEVALAAADAVSVLMRLGDRTNLPLVAWRERFESHFGTGTLVPVMEALSDVQGLGAPRGYSQPADMSLGDYPDQDTSDVRSQVLAALLAEALSRGESQIELTDEWLARFPEPELPAYPVLDVITEVVRPAADPDRWSAVVRPDGVTLGGRSLGRFHDVAAGAEELSQLIARREEASRPDALFAEAVYLSRYPRSGNVSRRPVVRTAEIAVNMPSTAGVQQMRLEDLLVGSNGRRLFLWSRSRDREVVVTEGHVLSLVSAPNVLRFLVEVSADGYALPGGLGWGVMEFAPFLPRVTRGRVVLSPARWTVRKSLLDRALGRDSADDQQAAVQAWRQEWGVPRFVHLADGDNRLLLDLESTASVGVLLSERERSERPVILHEMVPGPEEMLAHGPSGEQHVCEFAIPLATSDSGPPSAPGIVSASGRERNLTAGTPRETDWVCMKFYAPMDTHDELLRTHLQPWLALVAPNTAEAFYIRYADPDPHIRVRIRPMPGRRHEIAQNMEDLAICLCKSLVARRYESLDYVREEARYGGRDVIEAAESVFTAQSSVAIPALDAWARLPVSLPRELLAMTCMDIAADHLGYDVNQRVGLSRWLSGGRSATTYRQHRNIANELLGGRLRPDGTVGATARAVIEDLMRSHAQPARELVVAIAGAESAGTLTASADEVVASVLHMLVNRLMPSGGDHEREGLALWHQSIKAVSSSLRWKESV